jgi:hypothetical protein
MKIIEVIVINYKITTGWHKSLIIRFIILTGQTTPIYLWLAQLIQIISSLFLLLDYCFIKILLFFVPFRIAHKLICSQITCEMLKLLRNAIIFQWILNISLIISLKMRWQSNIVMHQVNILRENWNFAKIQLAFILLASWSMVIYIQTLYMFINVIFWCPVFLVHCRLKVAILQLLLPIITF